MKLSWVFFGYCITAVTLGAISPLSAEGQGLVTAPYPPQQATIIIHYQGTDFAGHYDYTFLSGSLEATGILPLNRRLFIFGSIPIGEYFAEHSNDTMSWSSSGAVIGNVSFGLGHRALTGGKTKLANSLVVMAKTMPALDDLSSESYWAMFAGWYSDPYRSERFARRHWTIMTNSQLLFDIRPHMGICCELRPQLYLPDGKWGHSQLWLNAGVALRYGVSRVQAIAEYVVAAWVSGDDKMSVHSRDYDAAGFGILIRFQKIIPTLYYQFALDEFKRTRVDGMWGLRLDIPLSPGDDE